jgi:excisionase family DNA binding protein
MRQVYTTGQVARMLNVTMSTVTRWFDAGRLRGFRLPPKQDRRIPRENLVHFLEEHNMPLPTELTHPDGCSCGNPDCPQYQADSQGIAR